MLANSAAQFKYMTALELLKSLNDDWCKGELKPVLYEITVVRNINIHTTAKTDYC